MTFTSPFHTDSPEYPPSHRNVHHYNTVCKFGQDIKSFHRVAGEGGRPPCSECARLEREGR